VRSRSRLAHRKSVPPVGGSCHERAALPGRGREVGPLRPRELLEALEHLPHLVVCSGGCTSRAQLQGKPDGVAVDTEECIHVVGLPASHQQSSPTVDVLDRLSPITGSPLGGMRFDRTAVLRDAELQNGTFGWHGETGGSDVPSDRDSPLDRSTSAGREALRQAVRPRSARHESLPRNRRRRG
jgi:hypothetical protein